jgi:hypothetical protein
MIGTEKQIAWANDIKSKMTKWFEIFSSDKTITTHEVNFYNEIMKIESAEFWIDAKAGTMEGNFEWVYDRAKNKGLLK